jgi:hypothetical protein
MLAFGGMAVILADFEVKSIENFRPNLSVIGDSGAIWPLRK